MIKSHVRIGSRGSKLALWQANFFSDLLKTKGVESEITIIKTKGDLIQDLSFEKLEGKGFFTKEIEDALLNNEIDIAVHSMKDLPTDQPEGLVIGGISSRANPQDLLIISERSYDQKQTLRVTPNATIGSSSIRRKVQLSHYQHDIKFKDIRGNVPTRLKKLEEDAELDGIVLAAAGIERLKIDLSKFKIVPLNPKEFPPSPAQGVLAYQCRSEDLLHRRLLKSINDEASLASILVERKVLKLMHGGCQIPLGVYCERDTSGNFHCFASYRPKEEKPIIFSQISQSTSSNLAERIVEQLKIQK